MLGPQLASAAIAKELGGTYRSTALGAGPLANRMHSGGNVLRGSLECGDQLRPRGKQRKQSTDGLLLNERLESPTRALHRRQRVLVLADGFVGFDDYLVHLGVRV